MPARGVPSFLSPPLCSCGCSSEGRGWASGAPWGGALWLQHGAGSGPSPQPVSLRSQARAGPEGPEACDRVSGSGRVCGAPAALSSTFCHRAREVAPTELAGARGHGGPWARGPVLAVLNLLPPSPHARTAPHCTLARMRLLTGALPRPGWTPASYPSGPVWLIASTSAPECSWTTSRGSCVGPRGGTVGTGPHNAICLLVLCPLRGLSRPVCRPGSMWGHPRVQARGRVTRAGAVAGA